MVKEKKVVDLLESHKIFLSLQFIEKEEKECLTDYGRGLLTGLLDPDTKHTIPVVHRDEYERLERNHEVLKIAHADNICKLRKEIEVLKKKWWQK